MAEQTITEEVAIATPALPRPGESRNAAAPVDAITGRPSQETTLRANVTEEYVSGSALNISSGFAESLPPYIDSISAEFGADIYERIYRDGHIQGEINGIIFAAICGGWRLTCPVEKDPASDLNDETDPEYEQAEEIRQFCEDNLKRIKFFDFLRDMARACYLGHKVAEIVYEVGPDARLMLSRLKVKERYSYSFVVDNRKNLVGVLGNLAGRLTTNLVAPSLVDIEAQGNLLPREKFAIFTFAPENSDPRGTSLLSGCYNYWWLKMQTLAEYHKYLIIYASPSLVGELPEGAQPGRDPITQAVISAEDAMSDAIAGLKNNTAVVVGHGGDVRPVFQNATTGEAFLKALDYYDQQNTKAITAQALAAADAKHQTKASTGEQKDILDLGVEVLETGLCRMVETDILKPLIKYNYGEELAEKYCPTLALSAAAEADMKPIAEGFKAAKDAGILQSGHMPYAMSKLGLPVVEMDPEPEPLLPGEDPTDPADPTKKKTPTNNPRASMTSPSPQDVRLPLRRRMKR